MRERAGSRLGFGLLAALVAAGAGLRTWLLFPPFWGKHHWNEGHYAATALNFERFGWLIQANALGVDFTFSPLVPWLSALSSALFGNSEAALRLPHYLLGLATLPLVWILAGQMFGPGGHRLWAVALAAVTPGCVYYSRALQLEPAASFFALAGLVLFLAARRRLLEPALSPSGFPSAMAAPALFAASGAAWAFAVFTKYSMGVFALACLAAPAEAGPIQRRRRLLLALAAVFVVIFAAFPSLLWIRLWPLLAEDQTRQALEAGVPQVTGGTGFFLRLQEWSLRSLSDAVIRTPVILWHHAGLLWPLALVGMAHFRQARAHAVVLTFSWIWVFFIFSHPEAYLANRYYVVPSLYAWCCWGGYAAGRVGKRLAAAAERKQVAPRLQKAGAVFLVLAFVALHLDLLQDRFTRNALSRSHKKLSPPFSAFQLRAERYTDRLTLVDDPAAFYYAGADPVTIVTAGTSGVRRLLHEPRFEVVIWDAFASDKLRPADRLLLHKAGYREEFPLVFVRPRPGSPDAR